MSTNPWLLGFAALFGVGVATVRDFERGAANEIRSLLEGDNKKVEIRVKYPGLLSPAIGEVGIATIRASGFRTEGLPLYTEPKRSKKGSIECLRLELKDFYLRDLRCEELIAEIPKCRFDFNYAKNSKKIRLSESGVGQGTVRIRVQDLVPFILRKYSEIKEVSVSVDHGWIRVKGRGMFLIFNADFEIKAKIATNGPQLLLVDPIIRFDGKDPDEGSRIALMNTLNPIVDFDRDLDLLDAVFAEKVTLSQDMIVVTGKTKIPIKPE